MTQPSEPTRLDQLENITAILVSHAEATDRRINQVTENQLLIQQDIQLLTVRLDQLSETVRTQAEQAAIDRRQAEIDRAEFRTTVQGILDALTQRFSGNGHPE